MATVITDEERDVDGAVSGGRLLVEQGALPAALGWELKPEGLCQGDVCVPVRDRSSLLVDDRVDVGAVASAVGQLAVVDADNEVAAIALPGEQRRRALQDHRAAAFTLPDLDGAPHSLIEWRGKKKLLFAFASW